MTSIINNYVFLKEDNYTRKFSECDFLLDFPDNFRNRNVTEKFKDLPITLNKDNKELSLPTLILFYYNNTDNTVLRNWEKVGKEFENSIKDNDSNVLKYNIGFVNLDYENRILETFKKISKFSPFHWVKIKDINKKYFILFYYKYYPQYYYKKDTTPILIKTYFENFSWFDNISNSNWSKIKKFRTRVEHVMLKEGFYQYIGKDNEEYDVYIYDYVKNNTPPNETKIKFKKGDIFQSVGIKEGNLGLGLTPFIGKDKKLDEDSKIIYVKKSEKVKDTHVIFKEIDVDREKEEKSDLYIEMKKIEGKNSRKDFKDILLEVERNSSLEKLFNSLNSK